MTWLRIAFDHALTHAVSTDLAPALIADMAARGHVVDNYETKYGREIAKSLGGNPAAITEWAFDMGGMCHADMPMEPIAIDGLTIHVPCDQFGDVFGETQRQACRVFATGERYYKFKFWVHALVTSPSNRDRLIELMRAAQLRAGTRAMEFVDAVKRARAAGGVS